MKIKANIAGLTIVALFVIGIFLSSVLGYWRTEGSKVPAKFTTGIFEGEADPADIRGSYSFSDLEKAFDIPVDTLAKAFGFSNSENPEGIKIKEFESAYGFVGDLEIGTGSMRLFVALYNGLPFEMDEHTAIPQPAWNILNKEGATDKETLSSYSERVVSLEGLKISTEATTHTEVSDEETVIKGKTLFSDILDWGLSREQIENILGIPMGAPGESIRDYCNEQGIEFSTVKVPLQELLNLHVK